MIVEREDYFFLKVDSINFRASSDELVEVEFLFNDVPLKELFDESIAHCLFIDEIIKSLRRNGNFKILTCDCGEWGCGYTPVRVVHYDRVIHWIIDDYPVKPLRISFNKELLEDFVKPVKDLYSKRRVKVLGSFLLIIFLLSLTLLNPLIFVLLFFSLFVYSIVYTIKSIYEMYFKKK